MRRRLLILAGALVASVVLLDASPKSADAAGCLYFQYCSPSHVACRAACNGDAACLAACHDAYLDCCRT